MSNVTITIERSSDDLPSCIRVAEPGPRGHKSLAHIYRDGVDTFVVYARGREEYVCDSVHVAIGFAGGCVGVVPVPDHWHAIAEQFVAETQSNAVEDDALTAKM